MLGKLRSFEVSCTSDFRGESDKPTFRVIPPIIKQTSGT